MFHIKISIVHKCCCVMLGPYKMSPLSAYSIILIQDAQGTKQWGWLLPMCGQFRKPCWCTFALTTPISMGLEGVRFIDNLEICFFLQIYIIPSQIPLLLLQFSKIHVSFVGETCILEINRGLFGTLHVSTTNSITITLKNINFTMFRDNLGHATYNISKWQFEITIMSCLCTTCNRFNMLLFSKCLSTICNIIIKMW